MTSCDLVVRMEGCRQKIYIEALLSGECILASIKMQYMYWDGRYVCACVEEPLLEFILCMKDKYMT